MLRASKRQQRQFKLKKDFPYECYIINQTSKGQEHHYDLGLTTNEHAVDNINRLEEKHDIQQMSAHALESLLMNLNDN